MSTSVPTPDTDEATEAGTWWQRHARRVWFTLRIGSILFLAVVATWWFLLASVAVTSHTVKTGTVTTEVMGTGTLEARTSAIVGPKIGGLIAHIAADEGDRVEAGALLFRLEDRDIEQQVAMVESEVAAAGATLDRLEAARLGADAVLAQARTNHDRIAALTSSNVASKQERDKAIEALSIARAAKSVAVAAIIEGQKRLETAKRSLEYQRARLADTTIEAPFDGLIVRRERDPGDVVAPASSVFKIVSTEEMWITAWVDETELARLHEGMPARVVLRSEPSVVYPGTVARVAREVDRETREILVDVRVDRLPAKWAVGQRAEAYIAVDRRDNATALPEEFVLVRDGQTGVVVNEGGRARWREITIGLRGRGVVEVVKGVSPGDVVVHSADPGGGSLSEGRRLTAP